MNNLVDAIWIELRKVTRSRMPLVTAIGFLIMPLACAFFMIILKDPEAARRAGLISAKAQLVAGAADWPSYLSLVGQATAIGGVLLFSLICSWVFGREFVDGTLKDILAIPVARSSMLVAKFIMVVLWSIVLVVEAYVVSLVLGAILQLPQGSAAVILQGSATVAVATALVVVTVLPFAFFASLGRGYLLPIGVTMLALLLANIFATIGWGSIFPWAVPMLYASGDRRTELVAISYVIVLLTGLAGLIGTYLWWMFADQNR